MAILQKMNALNRVDLSELAERLNKLTPTSTTSSVNVIESTTPTLTYEQFIKELSQAKRVT
jgi:UDP-N-acetyl-D-mannosaminuronate dehydrogenase